MTKSSMKIQAEHLSRLAIIYIRQSTPTQLIHHKESTERQYALQEKALSLGWTPDLIRIIDEDLGISGSGRVQRYGFQKLVTQVSFGEVGAIFGLEISRLARSSADLHRLIELCGLFNTIVVDEDGIYNLKDFNDRLLLGLKGTMSEVELHFLRARMLGGKMNKAKKGELKFPLPVGYVYDSVGKVVFDPNQEVQTAINNVFHIFQVSGSAYGVVKYFAQNSLKFPKRAYGGNWDGQLVWGTLSHSRVLGMLYNPSYAGAYVFGRYHDQKSVNQQGLFIHHMIKLPKDKWEVFIPDHHQKYISWEVYESNLMLLHDNRTNLECSGASREGAALLQGLVMCGKCGRRMSIRYTGNGGISPKYECKWRWEHEKTKSTCTTVPTGSIDQAISAKLLQAVQPAELELSLQVMEKLLVEEDVADKAWKLSIERANYEVKRAERQYQNVEPENRLVARSLESNWNEKLLDLAKLQEECEQYLLQRSWRPTEQDKVDILSMAKELPRIWNSQTTTPKEKKRILRTLIEDITVFAEAKESRIRLGIRWKSQFCEEIYAEKPLPKSMTRKHTQKTVETIRDLSSNMTDLQIANHLNEIGMRTSEGRLFTVASIKWIRYVHKIKSIQRTEGSLSVKEVAEELNVSVGIVYYWISHGILEAKKIAPGWPWEIKMDKHTKQRLKEIIRKSSHL